MTMIRRTIKFLFFMPVLIWFFQFSNVYGQEESKLTEQEKAVAAFFALNGEEPDFTVWTRASETYTGADQTIQQEIFEQERLRLKWGFGTYDVRSDFLKINTEVMSWLSSSDGKNPPVLSFHFPHSHRDYVPYFPYSYGEEWIALIVKDLPTFSSIPLGKEEYDYVSQYIEPGDEPHEAQLIIRIRPLSADNSEPLSLDGFDQWLMMGDIAYLRFDVSDKKTGNNLKLWEYSSLWYLSDTQNELLSILEAD